MKEWSGGLTSPKVGGGMAPWSITKEVAPAVDSSYLKATIP